MKLIIGSENWPQDLRKWADSVERELWRDFIPVPPDEIELLGKSLGRVLPGDFRAFLSIVGSGNFPVRFGGGIFSPTEILEGCAGPLVMLLGSSRWASDEDNRRFYITRGEFNPDPERLVSSVTKYDNIDILDLVQIGYDGMSCYYQLVCPITTRPQFGFCRITPDGVFDDRAESFSRGLTRMLLRFRDLDG